MKAHGSRVGLRAFENLKPYYVRRLIEMNTCACKYHVKMVELQEGFNNMRHGSKGVHGTNCKYNCDVCCNSTNTSNECKASYMTFQGLTNMWTSIMYPTTGDSTFHDFKILTRRVS